MRIEDIFENRESFDEVYERANVLVQKGTGVSFPFSDLEGSISEEARNLGLNGDIARIYQQMLRKGYDFYQFDGNPDFKKINRTKIEMHNVIERIKFNIENSDNDNARGLRDYITDFLSILLDTLQFYNEQHL